MLRLTKIFAMISIGILIISVLSACNFPNSVIQSSSPSNTTSSKDDEIPITFEVKLHEPLQPGDSVYLSLLDEVPGFSDDPQKFIMNAENALTYSATLPLEAGRLIKYRYSREGDGIFSEQMSNDLPVRYRLFQVNQAAVIQDMVNHWSDTVYPGPFGRITGQVTDSSNGKAIANILVTAGGEQVLTGTDGSYQIDGLPAGTHNLVFYALDGLYHLHQQGAIVAEDSTTPATVQLEPANLVTVIFTVSVPSTTPEAASIRLAGNLLQLGNTFDMQGGESIDSQRTPLLGKLPDGRYMVTLNLPAGAFVEYKYVLGDGTFIPEMTSDGGPVLRRMVVGEVNLEKNDTVAAWNLAR